MRIGLAAALALLAGCALPPRIDDRTTPTRSFATFRGALARGEARREFASFSDPLRARLGVESPQEWATVRVVALKQGHVLVTAIRNAEVVGSPHPLPDGRTLLEVELKYLLFSRRARVWMRPVPVLRVFVAGREEPVLYWDLPAFRLVRDDAAGVLGVRVPSEVLEAFELEPGEVPERLEAGVEWFLDDFEVGGGETEPQG